MTAPVSPVPDADPLKDARGKDYPLPGEQAVGVSGGKTTDYIYRLLQESDAAAQARYQKAARNLLMSDGRQWIDWRRTDRAWRDIPVPDGKVRTVANYIRPILRSRQQRVLSSNLQWRCEPQTSSHEERDRATIAQRFLETRFNKSDMDGKLRLALFLADNCGVSYLKSFWNPTLGPRQTASVTLPHPQTHQPTTYPVAPNGQPLADPQGNPLPDSDPRAFAYRPGDTDCTVRTLFNVRLNPEATGLEPDEGFRWLVDLDLVPLSVVKETWKDAAKLVSADQGNAVLAQYQRLISALGPLSFGTSGIMDTARLATNPSQANSQVLFCEYWEAPSELLPQGRLIVVAGQVTLYDGPLPQGVIPHTAIYCERRPLDAYGRPVVDDLVPPQRTINIQLSAILSELQREGVGQWAVMDVPGLAEQISNYDGTILKVPMRAMTANRSIGDVVQRVPPTPINNARVAMIQMAQQQMFDIGSFHEIQRGQVPPGVDSGVAVQLLMEADNAQLNDTVRQLELSLIRWARQQLRLGRWGYGDEEQRWLPAGDPSLNYLVEAVSGPDLPDPDEVVVSLDGFKPTSAAANRADIKDAVLTQMISPQEGRQLLDLGRGLKGAFASETRQYTKARRENLMLQREQFLSVPAPEHSPTAGNLAFLHLDGSPFLLPNDDDHELHIITHREIALDDTQPWPIRQAVLMHIQEHRAVQQMMVAALNPPVPPPETAHAA